VRLTWSNAFFDFPNVFVSDLTTIADIPKPQK